MNITPEFNLRNRVLAITAVVGSLLLSGCGGDTETDAGPQVVSNIDPVSASLNEYRDDVFYHRHARVALNACAGWQNVSGGITVVENPGVVTTQTAEGKYSYLVFSITDSDKKPPHLQQMNGPQVLVDDKNRVFGGGPYNVNLSVDIGKAGSYYAHATERALSQHLISAKNGQEYFEDAQTGAPVINSIITDGPFKDKRVWNICEKLGKDEPVPSLP